MQKELYDLFLAYLFGCDLLDVMQWYFFYRVIADHRYMSSRSFIAKSNMRIDILSIFVDDRFRLFARMTRFSFRKIVNLIKDDEIFQNKSYISQTTVEAQLLFALYKLRHSRNANAFRHVFVLWGVFEGHVLDCTRRVVKALYKLRNEYVCWPDERRRRQESLKNDEREEFIEAVGTIDEIDAVLEFQSRGKYQGANFFNRKKRYALNLCAVCNSDLEITYMLIEWPDSQHDARVFASIKIGQQSQNFFSLREYLLDDSAYTNTNYMITPYKAPEKDWPVNKRFNKKLSRVRIDIEHAFGMLKGRWQSLTRLRLKIRNQKHYKYAMQWITVCVILHNVLLKSDAWEKKDGWWTDDEVDEHADELNLLNQQQLREGILKREHMKEVILGRQELP